MSFQWHEFMALARSLAEKGRRLLELRRTADYDISPACSLKNTQHAPSLADELLCALSST